VKILKYLFKNLPFYSLQVFVCIEFPNFLVYQVSNRQNSGLQTSWILNLAEPNENPIFFELPIPHTSMIPSMACIGMVTGGDHHQEAPPLEIPRLPCLPSPFTTPPRGPTGRPTGVDAADMICARLARSR
jgi:hypothetical protein